VVQTSDAEPVEGRPSFPRDTIPPFGFSSRPRQEELTKQIIGGRSVDRG
jgi:hypothetical protein